MRADCGRGRTDSREDLRKIRPPCGGGRRGGRGPQRRRRRPTGRIPLGEVVLASARRRSRPGFANQGPHGGVPSRATRFHKTHKTGFHEVRYTWHPLVARTLWIEGFRSKGRCRMARCLLEREDRRDCFEVPAWMFDQDVCATMNVVAEPMVAWKALLELRRLLDDTMLVKKHPELLQEPNQADQGKPDAQGETAGRAAGIVRGTENLCFLCVLWGARIRALKQFPSPRRARSGAGASARPR